MSQDAARVAVCYKIKCKSHCESQMGFPKIRSTFYEGHYNKGYCAFESILGSLAYGNYQFPVTRVFLYARPALHALRRGAKGIPGSRVWDLVAVQELASSHHIGRHILIDSKMYRMYASYP